MKLRETIRKVLREEHEDMHKKFNVFMLRRDYQIKDSIKKAMKIILPAVNANGIDKSKDFVVEAICNSAVILLFNENNLDLGGEEYYEWAKIYLKKYYSDYIKEKLKSDKGEMKEGLHDTSWENDGNKVTLIDLLSATKDIPVENISVEELKPHLLTWDNDKEEIKKIDKADLQYPILVFVDNDGEFISIIDGHHRAQKAVRKGLETIKGKIIPINSLPKDIRKVFAHTGKQEEMKEAELTEKCWAGYTQKGMKTMFGKRYPNCVKKKK